MKIQLYFFAFFFIFLSACKKDEIKKQKNDFTIKIGLQREPRAICPIKRNGSIERQINQYIFLQAADYNPFNLINTPVLIENLPVEQSIDTGKYKETYRYDLTFKKEAKWDNGNPITGYDQLFLIKTILNPMIEIHPAIRNLYKKVKGIEVDKNNPKKISIYTDKSYMLSKEMVTNMEIFPEYFYDPDNVMKEIDFKYFLKPQLLQSILDTLKGAKDFAKKMNSTFFMRDNISGPGPYYLEKWETNQYIILNRKENYWGNDSKIPYLQNNPTKIIFKFISDKITSLTELKNGNIDILSGVEGSEFNKMKNDIKYNTKFDFYNPLSMKYYFIILNNRNPILKEKNIRKALAYLTDVDFLIKSFGTGGEKRLTSPVHPSKPYYNNMLKPIPFSLEKAKKLLDDAGWKDYDKNGIREKMIAGKKEDLILKFISKGKGLGKNIGLLLQENAKKAGIKIEIESKSNKAFRNSLKSRNFDLIPSIINEDIADVDPFWDWHSNNAIPGGTNISGFTNEKLDEIINKLRNTREEKNRADYYKTFQTMIYDFQPVIFLYVPTNNIIVNKIFKLRPSIKRPGYFANTVIKE